MSWLISSSVWICRQYFCMFMCLRVLCMCACVLGGANTGLYYRDRNIHGHRIREVHRDKQTARYMCCRTNSANKGFTTIYQLYLFWYIAMNIVQLFHTFTFCTNACSWDKWHISICLLPSHVLYVNVHVKALARFMLYILVHIKSHLAQFITLSWTRIKRIEAL